MVSSQMDRTSETDTMTGSPTKHSPRRSDTEDSHSVHRQNMDMPDSENANNEIRESVIRDIFQLPEHTTFHKDFSCAIAGTLATHGRMYPTDTYICFYSNVFGRERKILIPYDTIKDIAKTTAMVFQGAIRISTNDNEEFTFTSFWGANRDKCYDTLQRVFSPHTSSSAVEDQTDDSLASQATDSDKEVPEEEKPVESPKADQIQETAEEPVKDKPQDKSEVKDVGSIVSEDISMTTILETTFPISTDEFMKRFILDEATFGFDTFNKNVGATEIQVSKWEASEDDDTSILSFDVDKMIEAKPREWIEKRRSVQLRTPLTAPIGPDSSRVDSLQCYSQLEQSCYTLESSTRLCDIPYGDYFSVEERWTISPDNTNHTALRIDLKVVFSKSTFWKSTIETRAVSDNKTKWEEWSKMAKDHLNAPNSTIEKAASTQTSNSHDTKDKRTQVHDRRSRLNGERSQSSVSEKSRSRNRRREQPQVHKVFPWLLVLILSLVVLRLQLSLVRMEESLAESRDEIQLMREEVSKLVKTLQE